ncbi:MAG TPA: YqgE/AlgH family protein [Myxococcaceae bacterium]|nr:YqgE/AlgH family protein [Myxococcaceae bacterium]
MERLSAGFLIAMPQLGDPNFHRAVVLVLEHSAEGAVGLVLNRPAPELTLEELAKSQSLRVAGALGREPVYLGGPVETHRGFLLHDRSGVAEKHSIVPGVFLSETKDSLAELLGEGAGNVRFFLGYAGWGPLQLEQELAQGTWLFTEATSERVLKTDPGSLWDEVLRQMGVDPAMLQSSAVQHKDPRTN